MKKLPEVVAIKMSELLTVLQNVMDDQKMAGAEACLSGDFSQVTIINDSCRKLQQLELDIKAAMNSFNAKYQDGPAEKSSCYKKDNKRTRKQSGHLRITVAGKVIEKNTLAETFVETLKIIGLEQVAKLNKTVTSIPLIARTPTNGYQAQKYCNGWYITTHVNKVSAKAMLEEIAKALNMVVKVEFIEH